MSEGKVMLVEDDSEIRELLMLYLRRHRYEVIAAGDGEEALALAKEEAPDLLLLDMMLPGRDGLDVCEQIRRTCDIPIIFISCKRESEDIIQGLQLGADDYITKPFDPNVVIARVQAQLRRASASRKASAAYLWQDERLEIEANSLEVRIDRKPVSLYAMERKLLLFLAGRPNQVFSVEQLYEQIWGLDKGSDERTVMVHIRNLRKKIEKNPQRPVYIQTVRGFGYKFTENK